MATPWVQNKDLKCVVLGAGKGTRILPHSIEKPKVMLEFNNKPLLRYVIDFWKKFTDDFIFIVGYKKEHIINYVKDLPIKSTFVEQTKLRGIADAIRLVKDLVSDNFIVALGDCICNGTFFFPKDMDQGVGVWETVNLEYIKNSYSIQIKNGYLKRVVEKPKEIPNNYCGMGFYFFKKKVFKYIDETPPSSLRNEIEITDVIQNMIDKKERIRPVFFKGNYLNVTFPEDLNSWKDNIL